MKERKGYIKKSNPSFLKNIFYMNIKSREDKRQFVEKQFNKLNFNISRISGAVGTELSFKNLYKFGKCLCDKSLIEYPIDKVCGIYGKVTTHNHVLNHATKSISHVKEVTIFEDDVVLHKNFINLYSFYIDFVPIDWDIILLGCVCNKCNFINPYVSRVIDFRGSHALIIKQTLFRTLISLYSNPYNDVDIMLSNLTHKHKFYTFNKQLAIQRFIKNDTTHTRHSLYFDDNGNFLNIDGVDYENFKG